MITAPSQPGPEAVLNCFHDGVEKTSLVERVDQGEAVDHASAAAEHHLLVNHSPASGAWQNSPSSTDRRVVDAQSRVGLMGQEPLVRSGRVVVDVFDCADEKLSSPVRCREQISIAGLRRAVVGENRSGHAKLEAKSIVMIGHPSKSRLRHPGDSRTPDANADYDVAQHFPTLRIDWRQN
jgi:hypothetical protein